MCKIANIFGNFLQMETFPAKLALCAATHRLPVNSPHKGRWRGAFMFSLICAWANSWVTNRGWFVTPSRSLWLHCNGYHKKAHLIKIVFIFYEMYLPEHDPDISGAQHSSKAAINNKLYIYIYDEMIVSLTAFESETSCSHFTNYVNW